MWSLTSQRERRTSGPEHFRPCKARYWDDSMGTVTLGAIDPLLEAVEVGPGVRVLDIACGTGALAAAAARRGADVIGMDFAPTMITEAIRRHPGINFRVGDAEAIPLADESVDAVTCSFGMLHMERPERVLAEVARVLRPATGRFALTSWTSDGEFYALVGQAVQAHADMGVPLPLAPPIFRYGDEGECRSALLARYRQRAGNIVIKWPALLTTARRP